MPKLTKKQVAIAFAISIFLGIPALIAYEVQQHHVIAPIAPIAPIIDPHNTIVVKHIVNHNGGKVIIIPIDKKCDADKGYIEGIFPN
jgi:hypothetical protein